jgi:transcription initiation factor TFIIB
MADDLESAAGEISRLAENLNLPKTVQDTANVLFEEAINNSRNRNHSVEALATAALYAVCKRRDIPRCVHDFKSASTADADEIKRAYRSLVKNHDLEIQPSPPGLFIYRYCDELGLGDEIEELANELVDAAVKENLHSGRSACAVSACAIYGACKLSDKEITQADLAEHIGVSSFTVSRYREMIEAYKDSQAD